MKLQMRFLLLLLVVFSALAGLLVTQRSFDIQRSNQVLQSELSSRKQLFATNLNSEGAPFQTLLEDYSFWDDMVSFVKTGDQNFAHVNLDSGLTTFGADADWVYRPNGTLVYSSHVAGSPMVSDLRLPKDFFQRVSAQKFAHFYVQMPSGMFEVRAATIVPGTDVNHSTPAQGYWVIGRFLGPDFLSRMNNLSQSTVSFLPASTRVSDQTGSNSVSFSVPLKDFNGTTVQVLRSSSTVGLIDQLNSLYQREIIFLSVLGGVILIVILITLWWLVLRPLTAISNSIQKQQPELLNRLAKSSSEFGSLAHIVQQFFTQKITIEEDAFKKAELEHLNKDKTAFLAVAAHELKAPGSIIKLISEDLPKTAATATPEQLAHQLDIIAHQATKMTSLVTDLRLASEGKDNTTLQQAPFEFDSFLQKEVTELGYILDQQLVISGGTGQTITGDAERLGQVVSNLVRNAAKYSPDADRIDIRSGVVNGAIQVEVQDYGVGISPEDQAHIFERFYRAPSVADSFQGLGLGLSISKTIIDRMGGRMWVESQVGQGTKMFFAVPLTPVQPAYAGGN